MGTGSLVCALFGLSTVACGSRTDLIGAPVGTNDAGTGTIAEAAATFGARGMPEGSSMVDEAGAAGCYIALSVATRAMPRCSVALPPDNNGCGPSEYQVACGTPVELGDFTVPDGCYSPRHNGDMCCPCLGADVRPVCADLDLSTYDVSCSSDSDCIVVKGVIACTGLCWCGGDVAINVDGLARYEQTLAPLQSSLDNNCCDDWPVCIQGACGVAIRTSP